MKRILIVDDQQESVYYLSSLLRAHGFEVDSARHGAEALAKARQSPPDIVVSDLLMPVMDGYTLLRQWKQDARLKRAPFVVYTATYTEPEDQQLAHELGADAFIVKPTEPIDILARIQEAAMRPPSATPDRAPESDERDERALLEQYSAALVRKLEQKMLQLEASNRALQEDVAARVRAEVALDTAQYQASERAALLDALFASVPDVVMQLDLDGTIRVCNRRCALFPTESPEGSSWLTSGPSEHQPAIVQSFRSVVKSGQPESLELNVATDTGSVTYWLSIAPVVRAGRITSVVVVLRDISERKQFEAQLMVADRMASVGNLAASIVHEINNPLMCVTANLPMIEDSLEPLIRDQRVPPEVLDALRDAREGAERVCLIARDLRIFSRADEAARAAVDVEQVLESTLRMARSELRHRARLVKRYQRVPPVAANESRLGQVFLNLILNAVHAMREDDIEPHELSVATEYDSFTRRVTVSISDTGSGIAPEIRPRLFKPFVTTKPVSVGTGLGLSICHRIVTALGGSIDFSDRSGRGTTFRVALPIAAEQTAALEGPAPAPAIAPVRGRLLVVDDDEGVTQAVRRALANEHEVRTVNSVDDALRLFHAGERYDIVLCDLILPRVTGMELYHELCALDREQAARVIFMTGGVVMPKARAFLDGVDNPRLEKPFELAGLRALIHQRLQRRQALR